MMKRTNFLLFAVFWSFGLWAQDSLNMQKLGQFTYPGSSTNDVWGYTAPDGSEYALVGLTNGVSIVDISQAPALNEIIRIPGVNSTWRDLKTWGHYAYVTHDNPILPTLPNNGLLIIDLDSIEHGKTPEYSYQFPAFFDPNCGGGASLQVIAPSGISGAYSAVPASFGPALTSVSITSDLVLAVDNTAPVNDGCEPFTNAGAINGRIALIDRGTCPFVTKVQEAQNAGAVAAVIVNNQPGQIFAMGGATGSISIPSVMISQADGQLIKNALASGAVNVTLGKGSGCMDSMQTAHNLYIDEQGVMYLFGSNNPQSGVCILYDVASDPENPQYLSTWSEHYLHDGMARGDTLWGSAVYDGQFYVIDVSDKTAPLTQASAPTSSQFTHNSWISDDNQTLFTTDEVAGAYVTAYDVSDLGNIRELDRIRSGIDSIAPPHNAHVYGGFLVNSFYTSGVQIVDAHQPDILVETGYYDTSPFSGTGNFDGAWGAYPYFPSGRIAVTDREEGLFLLDTDYPRAGYWRAIFLDAVTGAALAGVSVFDAPAGLQFTSDLSGKVKWGSLPTNLNAVAYLQGYDTSFVSVNLNAGWVENDTILMYPPDFQVSEGNSPQTELYPVPSVDGQLVLDGLTGAEDRLRVLDAQGRLHSEIILKPDGRGRRSFRFDGARGIYLLEVYKGGERMSSHRLIID